MSLENLEECLLNRSGKVPLHSRFRALFTLKSLKNEDAIDIIAKGFDDPSALLKHELAYCLGQIGNTHALPCLESVLENENEDPMVRHEAAEAMGAISSTSSLAVLRKYLDDPQRAVRETCEIAIDKIEWDNSEQARVEKTENKTYTSIDPAPPTSLFTGPKDPQENDVHVLRDQLLDKSLPLFKRYRAMFGLRNIGTDEAVDALVEGFGDDSALFKHEIAFIFGQLLSPHSVPALLSVLQNSDEDEMVRHEAAEALGGIATQEVKPHLEEWSKRDDAPVVVKESCVVALDMWEYENSGDFQYADGLGQGTAISVGA